jgi:hypothetical protein
VKAASDPAVAKGEKCFYNGDGSKLYWINDDIWELDVDKNTLPPKPFIAAKGTIYYGLTVDPVSGDVYVADAIDY